jgi:hypothetical protein
VGVWEPAFVTFGGFVFELLTFFILRGHNFFNFILFLTIFITLDAPIGGVQVLFTHKNNGTLPLNLACFQHLNVIITTQLQLMNN